MNRLPHLWHETCLNCTEKKSFFLIFQEDEEDLIFNDNNEVFCELFVSHYKAWMKYMMMI